MSSAKDKITYLKVGRNGAPDQEVDGSGQATHQEPEKPRAKPWDIIAAVLMVAAGAILLAGYVFGWFEPN